MFDLNILPMNLVNGRNLGELPGLKVYTAPKKCDKSRQNDILISLISLDDGQPTKKELEEWGEILAEGYFNARGSFTMGISAAVRQLATHLDEKYPGTLLPAVLLNMGILRDRTLLIGHAGPVNTTVVYADHVDNFSDITSQNISQGSQGLRFFQIEIHSGDLVLMCPRVPQGWTNEAILDATSESPLNVIRYLLDQAHGNLQGVVIQVKAGRGEILYRYKPPISTSVNLGYQDDFAELDRPVVDSAAQPAFNAQSDRSPAGAPGYLSGSDAEKSKPLFRTRLPYEPFPVGISLKNRPQPAPAQPPAPAEPTMPVEPPIPVPPWEKQSAAEVLPAKAETAAETKPESFAEALPVETAPVAPTSSRVEPELGKTEIETKEAAAPQQSKQSRKADLKKKKKVREEKKEQPRKAFPWKRVLIGLVLGICVPLLVVTGLFMVYTNRSKDAAYRDSLSNAVETAKVAVQQKEPSLQRVSWEKVLEYLDEAAIYGKSEASRELRAQALESLDKLENGKPVIYQFALSKALPASTKITQIDATDQFMYALDANSGSVLRFNIYSNGLAQDTAFSCIPGTYANKEKSSDETQLTIGKLVDFVILPSESNNERVIAAVDNNAQVLFCSTLAERTVLKLDAPPIGWLGVDGVYFSDRTLYVLDARNNAIWKFPYLGVNGFSTSPASYFGSSAPGMRDVTDFVVYDNYAYLLRKTGTLIVCDYTGYIPLCSNVDELKFANQDLTIDLTTKRIMQIKMNLSPDTSIYMMDNKQQAILNMSVKLNLVRNAVPDRFQSAGSGETVTAFGFLDPFKIVWASGNALYVGTFQ